MKKAFHQIHDEFFKRSLKEKRIMIDFLKAYLPPNLYEKRAINSLQLTEKSFIIPEQHQHKLNSKAKSISIEEQI